MSDIPEMEHPEEYLIALQDMRRLNLDEQLFLATNVVATNLCYLAGCDDLLYERHLRLHLTNLRRRRERLKPYV
jgi:hypothetical protein